MFSKIFGKKSDHPMVDVKSTRAILDDLPKNDTFKLLTELIEWIDSIADNSEFKVDHQFSILRMLDDTAQPHAKKLAREYFTSQELNEFQENRIWLILDRISRSIAAAYFAVFKRYNSSGKGNHTIKIQLPLLLAHTINAYVTQIKYICVRYGTIDASTWSNLAQIYNCAEVQKMLDTPVSFTSGTGSNTTVRSQFLRLVTWYGTDVHSLVSSDINLAERIVAQYCAFIEINSLSGENDFLRFDLAKDEAPTRYVKTGEVHPTVRFVTVERLLPKLTSLMSVLEKNVIPDDLNLGGAYDAKLVQGVVQRLLYSLQRPPLKPSVRSLSKAKLTVVCGFENMVSHVTAGLNLTAAKPVQWEIDEVGAGGVLTILPPVGLDDLSIGDLLGIQPAGVANFGAAIVRRIVRDANNQFHVGIEILANQIGCVALNLGNSNEGGYFEEGQLAFWLYAQHTDPIKDVQLLMHVDVYSGGRSLQTEIDEKNYLLIPNGTQEKGEDYELAKFRLIEQDTSHSEEVE